MRDDLLGVGVALGCGLLIGIERERRKGRGPGRALAGVRTFALAALLGAVGQALGQPALLGAGAVLVAVLAAIGYLQDRRRGTTDPGVTTELALFVTFLLGVTAIDRPALAAAAAVVVAAVLAARTELHRFATDVLTADELRDALLLAGAALVVLPLVPSEPIAWLGGVDPRRLWALVVLLIALQAAGYIAVRVAGPRFGLPLSGLASGFVSSTATVAAMAARARSDPRLVSACAAAALLSSVATPVQLLLVAAAVHPPALRAIAPSLALAAVAAALFAVANLRRAPAGSAERPRGRAFSVSAAVVLAIVLTAVTAAASLASARYGRGAAVVTAALAGFADVHAAAASVLALAAGGGLAARDVVLPILVAFTTNVVSKLVAASAGSRGYRIRVSAGLAASAAAVWAPWLLGRLG